MKITEMTMRALVALAKRNLADANKTCGDDWPAGQKWHQLGPSSQGVFMQKARAEAGIPDAPYLVIVRSDTNNADNLTEVWDTLIAESAAEED